MVHLRFWHVHKAQRDEVCIEKRKITGSGWRRQEMESPSDPR